MIRRNVGLTAALLASVFLLGGTATADSRPVQIRRIEAGAFPTIGVTVSVPGDVAPGDVRIDENGSPAQILSIRPLLESGGQIDVVLAIDTSESVAGEPLAQAVQAAERLVSTVPSSMPIGVVTFSDRPRVLVPITSDHSVVTQALRSITTTQPGTALYDGIGTAAQMFSGSAQHNLILLTDGTDVGSKLDLPAATAAAKGASVTVFSIGLEGARTTFSALQQVSAATGGTFSLATASNLSSLYAQLGRKLSSQYLVQYQSASAHGAQVTITVHTPRGSDSSTSLIPRASGILSIAEPSRPLLTGLWGLLVVLFLTFGATFLLGSFLFAQRARTVRDRELARRMLAAPDETADVPSRPDAGLTTWIPQPLVQVGEAVAEIGGFQASLDQMLERAGLPITAGEVVAATVIAGIAGMLVGGFLFRNLLIAVVLGIVVGLMPYVLLSRKMNKRVNLLHSQLPDVLMILASSMRAGHSFLQALDTVAKEIGEPSGPEFARVVTEIRLGRPFDKALGALAERVGTAEFKWAVLGVNVQREVGGNLAEILDTLAETVRDREQIRRQVKVLSAEGRMSVKILILMPLLITLYLAWVNPAYMKLLWTTRLGFGFIAAGVILMIIGTFWSRKVVKIDV